MLSTRGKGTLAGAVAGACAICIAVCAQMAAPLPHSPEQAQAITAEEASVSTASGGSAARSDESARSGSGRAHAVVANASAALEEALGGEPEGAPAEAAKPEAEAGDSARRQGESAAEPPSSTADGGKRKWVVDYKQVWVDEPVEIEDVPGHYEDVIEYRDTLVCLSPGCGFSATSGDEMAAHSAQHALRGEDDSSGSLPQPYVAGSNWVEPVTHIEYKKVPKTVEDGGHWE